MPTLSWTVSFTMPTASNSPAKACAGHEANRTRRLDQPPSPVTQIHRPARLATRAASFRSGGRHHSGIPGDIIPLYPGDFVGIRRRPPRVSPSISTHTNSTISSHAYGGDSVTQGVRRSLLNLEAVTRSPTNQPLRLMAFQAAKPLRQHIKALN